MFEMFAEVYIEGSVWSDFSDLIGRDIKYYDHQNNVVNGVVQSLSVGDIWEDTMSTERGTFLDVYAEIDGVDGESVCVGMLNLLGHGWTWEQIRTVTDWLEVHGFESVTTPICRWYHNPNDCEDMGCPMHGIKAMPFRWIEGDLAS
tara:strand:- start:1728 stop:2165 length:438 start_codon:yes stop_codon:yes gene_type:complete